MEGAPGMSGRSWVRVRGRKVREVEVTSNLAGSFAALRMTALKRLRMTALERLRMTRLPWP
jgi:hypothetical protein